MNTFDIETITYLNKYSQHSWTFDALTVFIAGAHFLKGGLFAIVLWWAWFNDDERQSHYREQVVSILFCCVVAIFLARALALTTPFRLRPLHQAELNFLLPHRMKPTIWEGWSSFPSDHAVLFFTLSTGLVFISRNLGACALAYTALLIAFPRMYLGLHYPTDILAGALLGVAIATFGRKGLQATRISQKIVRFSQLKPSLFYPAFFVATHQIADMFDGIRRLAGVGAKLFRLLIH